MTQNEYIALVEEHGLGNLILTESYMHYNVKVEIVFDDKIIEYHKLINGLTKPWVHDAIEAKKQFDAVKNSCCVPLELLCSKCTYYRLSLNNGYCYMWHEKPLDNRCSVFDEIWPPLTKRELKKRIMRPINAC